MSATMTEISQSPEYTIDRKIEALMEQMARARDASPIDRAALRSELQELLASRARLMRPAPPTPPRYAYA